MIKLEYSIGNKKLGKDTLIINMTSATDCPSRRKGLCKIPAGKCYALRCEGRYPNVLPFRRRQAQQWQKYSSFKTVVGLLSIIKRHKKLKYIRINESGDFRNQRDVNKLYEIVLYLSSSGADIKIYTYTARRDLDFSLFTHLDNIVINGSGFMIHNNFLAVPEHTDSNRCAGDCRRCNKCKIRGLAIIQNKYH